MVNDIFGANYSGLVKEFIVTAELDMLIETPEYKSAPGQEVVKPQLRMVDLNLLTVLMRLCKSRILLVPPIRSACHNPR